MKTIKVIDLLNKIANGEVEIIEDTPKINKLVKWSDFEYDIAIQVCSIENLRGYISIIMQKQNEIIDKLNEMSDKE